MGELAAYLVDSVLPTAAGYRQYVISLPFELRNAVAFDASLRNAAFEIANEHMLRAIVAHAAEDGALGLLAGVLHLQRHGHAFELNEHVHFVISDGVFVPVRRRGHSASLPASPPKSEEPIVRGSHSRPPRPPRLRPTAV